MTCARGRACGSPAARFGRARRVRHGAACTSCPSTPRIAMPSRAHEREPRDAAAGHRGRTRNAAISGPSAEPTLPPTWNTDCAKPWRPPEASARDARGFRMEHRRADADQRRRRAAARVIRRLRQNQQPDECERHADRKRDRAVACGRCTWPTSGCSSEAVTWKTSVSSPICAETQVEAAFQDRIDRRQQRLHHVVQQVAEADRAENRESRGLGSVGRGDGRLAHSRYLSCRGPARTARGAEQRQVSATGDARHPSVSRPCHAGMGRETDLS